jgi:hypothetical protein
MIRMVGFISQSRSMLLNKWAFQEKVRTDILGLT